MSLITVDVTPDGRRFVTGGDDGDIWLWEISPIHRIALLGRHAARVKALAVSPDGRWAASGGDGSSEPAGPAACPIQDGSGADDGDTDASSSKSLGKRVSV